MSFDLNPTLNYDPIALSMINSFWEQPQYPVPDINHHNYYAPRYTPYNTYIPDPAYQPYASYPYNYYGQPVYYQVPIQQNQPEHPTYIEEPNSQTSYSTEDSLYSVESQPDSPSSLETTIRVVDTPAVEIFSIEIPDNADLLPPVDENVLKEVISTIDMTNIPDTPTKTEVTQPITFEISVKKGNPEAPNTDDVSRKYTCIACGKYFINRPGLRKHFKTKVHKKVVADKRIQDPYNDPHSWVSGEHKCFICGKGFVKHTDMIDHVVTH